MNDILKKEIISDRNYIQRPIGRIIPYYKRESSLERKSIKKSPRNNSAKNGKSKIIKKIKNFDLNNPNINNPKIICNNIIKLNYENNVYINNNIPNENNNIKINFKNAEKAKTFSRQLSNKNIKKIYEISKNKSNQISENFKNKIEISKEEKHKRKQTIGNLIISNNDNKNINNIKFNSINPIENINIIKRNSKRNTDGIILIKNKEKIKVKTKNIDTTNYINFNYTINTKNTTLSEPFPLNNIILTSNSFNKNKFSLPVNNKDLKNNYKKTKKNIDINTEYQTNSKVNNKFPEDKNIIINNFNNTTGKIKLVPNNFIKMNKNKEDYYLTENNNNIFKTKSKAKIKNEEPEIEVRIIETKENNIIFNNKRIPKNNNKIKKENILTEKNNQNINNEVKNTNKTDLSKKNVVKVKMSQNKNEIMNRISSYNNENSFFTSNLNNSNIEENNNELKMDLRKYDFPNNAHNNENIYSSNIKTSINEHNNNINYNNENEIKNNSNIEKNIKSIFNENKNFNIISNNNYSNCNTGNTTNNILNQKSNNENSINIIKEKIEAKNTKENDIEKREKIIIELDDSEEPKDSDVKKKDLKKEIKESTNNEKKEELKEKEISLDKTNSSRVFPIANEDFIEKDDEVLKLLNDKCLMKNNEIINNGFQLKDEEDSDITIQNSGFSFINEQSKYNYCLNNRNIYQNSKVNINNNNLKASNNGNNKNINNTNITIKDTSMISNYGIKGCKSITQAGKERTGHRKKNQDNYIIEKNLNNILGFNLFAVLDGHGENGHIVSQLASKYLVKKFLNSVNNLTDIESIFSFLKNSDYQEIINIFLEIDNEIINQKKFDVSLSGTTCVLVIQLGEHLICSNIGDSRAILIYEENNESKIFELSHDLKPNLPEEMKRINLMGGRVDQVLDENGEKTGPFRVYIKEEDSPGLAMSRSFGDKKAKSCGVISYPDIIEYNLNNNECKYMVICSDGVWEFLSNEEVMLIGDKYYNQNDMAKFCNELLKRATEFWENEENYMDDITIVTVFF